MFWLKVDPKATLDHLGLLPQMFDDLDPRSAKEQANDNYRHGGGWCPFVGFTLLPDGNLKYPGDPPTKLLYVAKLRDEIIRVYEWAWVMIMQADGSYEIARMD